MAVENRNAPRGRGIGQRLVEVRARNLEGVVPAGGELVGKIKVTGPIAPQKNRPALAHEAPRLDRLEQPGLLQQVHAMGQQAFANHKAREDLFLHDEQPKTFPVQQRGGG